MNADLNAEFEALNAEFNEETRKAWEAVEAVNAQFESERPAWVPTLESEKAAQAEEEWFAARETEQDKAAWYDQDR